MVFNRKDLSAKALCFLDVVYGLGDAKFFQGACDSLARIFEITELTGLVEKRNRCIAPRSIEPILPAKRRLFQDCRRALTFGSIMKIRIFPVQKPFLVQKIRADETGGVAK